MTKPRSTKRPQEAFVILRSTDHDGFARGLKTIESHGGQIRQSFPPRVVVAALPADQISALRAEPDVERVATQRIPVARTESKVSDLDLAIAAWNAHLTARRGRSSKAAGQGLTWDAAGHLPPDPPPEIRALLDERDREMQRGHEK